MALHRRVALFGGSFNPIHAGHLFVARSALKTFELDRVLFVPAAIPPHKQDLTLAPAGDRVAMIKLAIDDDDSLGMCLDEIERGGTSYTVDTLRHVRRELDESTHLYFIVGSDSLAELHLWRQWEVLLTLATFITVARERAEARQALDKLAVHVDRGTVDHLEKHILEVEPHPASSTEIRRRMQQGESVEDLVPVEVLEYIHEHKLYHEAPE